MHEIGHSLGRCGLLGFVNPPSENFSKFNNKYTKAMHKMCLKVMLKAEE